MLNVEIWPRAACLALFTLTQVVFSFAVPPSHSLHSLPLPPSLPTPSFQSSPSFYLLPPWWFTSQTSIYPPLTNFVNMLHHSLFAPPLPPPHFICSPALTSSSSGTPPPPSHLFLLQVLAAELWDVMSKWGMASASGGYRCGLVRTGTLDACAGFMCGWIMLVSHCSALLPPADRNVTGWLVYDRL